MNNKKKIATLLMVLTTGGVSGHYIDDIMEKYNLQTNRYPMNVEYKIIRDCISNDNKPISESLYRDKTEICICAMEKTEIEYPYELFREDNGYEFLDKFEVNTRDCM